MSAQRLDPEAKALLEDMIRRAPVTAPDEAPGQQGAQILGGMLDELIATARTDPVAGRLQELLFGEDGLVHEEPSVLDELVMGRLGLLSEDASVVRAERALAEPWVDDRGLSLADAAVLDAHHSGWAALKVLEGLDLERVGRLLTESERAEYTASAEAMGRWLDRYREAVTPLAERV